MLDGVLVSDDQLKLNIENVLGNPGHFKRRFALKVDCPLLKPRRYVHV